MTDAWTAPFVLVVDKARCYQPGLKWLREWSRIVKNGYRLTHDSCVSLANMGVEALDTRIKATFVFSILFSMGILLQYYIARSS